MSEWQPIETAPLDGTRIIVALSVFGDVVMASFKKDRCQCGLTDDAGSNGG